jgi:hypothetical protein
MGTYRWWNTCLVNYLTEGVPQDTPIFLNIDKSDLESIGRKYGHNPSCQDWSDDFRKATCSRVITQDGEIDLSGINGLYKDGTPRYLVFLVVMVLAANRMAEGEEIRETNYFVRLRGILDISGNDSGRPKGMRDGAEEVLWRQWQNWLRTKGFQPTAFPGEGSKKYIQYPISQTLLRDHDRDRLCQLFYEKEWRNLWDPETLGGLVRQEVKRLPAHLRELLKDRRQRYRPLIEAIHETYIHWITSGSPAPSKERGKFQSDRKVPYLYAELYRYEDLIMGEAEYYLYPRSSRYTSQFNLTVEINNSLYPLQVDRPGWFCPLGPISISEINTGNRYRLDGAEEEFRSLILPARDFWILVPQGDSDSEVYISGQSPRLGSPFIILCKESLLRDLEILKQERLLEWGNTTDLENHWVEINQCMVISEAWRGIHLKCRELREALRPSNKMAIQLSGGLRSPQESGWLCGYGPRLAVFGFFQNVEVNVTKLSDNKKVFSHRKLKTNASPIDIPWDESGFYLIDVSEEGEAIEKVVRLLSWEELPVKNLLQEDLYFSPVGKHRISGALTLDLWGKPND